MKHLFWAIVVLFPIANNVWGQNYKVKNINADDAVVGFVEDIVAKNIQADSHQYEFVLTQHGEAFSIEYNVSPDGIKGVSKTDDVWSELEATVLKAIQNIRAEMTPKATESAKQSARQSVQQQPEQQQIVQQQPTQQQYQQPVQQQIVQQQPPQQYQNQTQSVSSNSSNYNNNMTTQNYGANNYMSGSVSIGGLMRFPDGSQGVVFYLDSQGHGLAVSLDMTTAQWQAGKKKDCLNIAQIPDGDGENICVVGLGKQYTSTVVSQLGWGKAPAVEWCLRHGDGWYLPSAGELSKLFSTEKETKKMISASLKQYGGVGLADEWHWSSSENDKDEAINVSSSGWTTSEDKIEILHVRAVRAF